MPFTFEVVMILKRDENEELSLVRKTHNLYYPVVIHLVEAWTKLYRENGWRVERFYLQNFNFKDGDISYEHG
jgi:hypothetical protein